MARKVTSWECELESLFWWQSSGWTRVWWCGGQKNSWEAVSEVQVRTAGLLSCPWMVAAEMEQNNCLTYWRWTLLLSWVKEKGTSKASLSLSSGTEKMINEKRRNGKWWGRLRRLRGVRRGFSSHYVDVSRSVASGTVRRGWIQLVHWHLAEGSGKQSWR